MDSEYRKELKKHFKKSFETNKLDREAQVEDPTKNVVQSLMTLNSNAQTQATASRTIDALLDISLSSISSDRMYGTNETSERTSAYRNMRHNNSFQIENTTIACIETNEIGYESQANGGGGGDINDTSVKTSLSSHTVRSNLQSLFSKNSHFKKRTSRDLRNMVKSQCKVVESLNIVDSNCGPSMLLWKSKRKFNSSVDLCSDILKRSEASSSNLSKLKQIPAFQPPQKLLPVKCNGLTEMNAEKIVRDQITGPLIREVERVYVQSITTTADLLRKLECMPEDINRILSKKE